ncbi:phosphoglycerate dehydrogenase [Kwoniella heveanensis CBS 569]|nr:phosphoglycerate dehydrogenase [Kwoniella heveanensis CBS 569]
MTNILKMAESYLPTPPSEPEPDVALESASQPHPSVPLIPAKEATIYLHTPFHPKAEEYAVERFKEVLRPSDLGGDVGQLMGRADGILLRVGHITRDMLLAAPKLKIISRNGTGIDNMHLPTVKEKGVVVTNCPGGNARAVAELALALMLAVLRRVVEIDNRIRSGEKVPSITALAPGLFGSTVGLVGMGDTAYELARLLLAFGCRILVYSPTSPSNRWLVESPRYPVVIPHERVNSLDDLLNQVDVLSLHCPLNDQTRRMISTDQLIKMKDTAVLINTARGGVVDERALEQALESGQLGGAGIDVWDVEPAYGETMGKLGKLRNTVVLPHLGGSTDGATLEGCMRAIDIMADYLDGKGARNRVV